MTQPTKRRMESLPRQLIAAVGTHGLIIGFGLLTGILQARLLGPTGRGQLAAIQLWAGMLATLCTSGLIEAAIYFSAKQNSNAPRFAITGGAISLAAGCVLSVPLFLALPFLLSAQDASVTPDARIYLLLFVPLALLGAATALARSRQLSRQWNTLRLLPTLTWVVIVIGHAATGSTEAGQLALRYLAAVTVVAVLAFGVTFRGVRSEVRPTGESMGQVVSFGAPATLSSMPLLANQRIDQMLLAGLLTASDLGLYAVAIAIVNVSLTPAIAIALVALPRIARTQSTSHKMRQVTRYALLATGSVTVTACAIAATSTWLLVALFGSPFAAAASAAQVLLIGAPFRGLAQTLYTGAKGMGHPSVPLYSELLGLMAAGCVLVLRLDSLDLRHVAWAWVAGSVVSSASSAIAIRLLASRSLAPKDN